MAPLPTEAYGLPSPRSLLSLRTLALALLIALAFLRLGAGVAIDAEHVGTPPTTAPLSSPTPLPLWTGVLAFVDRLDRWVTPGRQGGMDFFPRLLPAVYLAVLFSVVAYLLRSSQVPGHLLFLLWLAVDPRSFAVLSSATPQGLALFWLWLMSSVLVEPGLPHLRRALIGGALWVGLGFSAPPLTHGAAWGLGCLCLAALDLRPTQWPRGRWAWGVGLTLALTVAATALLPRPPSVTTQPLSELLGTFVQALAGERAAPWKATAYSPGEFCTFVDLCSVRSTLMALPVGSFAYLWWIGVFTPFFLALFPRERRPLYWGLWGFVLFQSLSTVLGSQPAQWGERLTIARFAGDLLGSFIAASTVAKLYRSLMPAWRALRLSSTPSR